MRRIIESTVAAILALLGTVVLAVAWTAATAVQLAATALIMGGTQHPLSSPPDDPVGYVLPYLSNAVNGFINPAAESPTGTGNPGIGVVEAGDNRYAVITPEQFFPVFGSMTFDDSVAAGLANVTVCLRGGTGCGYNRVVPGAPAAPPSANDEFVVFGYSQSAVIASLLKRDLIENPSETPTVASFFLLANPMRPNGGILALGPRGLTIPILGVTFYGATPTNSCDTGTCLPTVDVAAQYDGLGGDAPSAITNVLAILNAAAGYIYLHGGLQNARFDNALYQGSHGDTDYYLYPTKRLPLLMPLNGIVPSPILTALDAPLRAAIEGAYQRTVNPGIATGLSLLPFHDPVQTVLNIIRAIPVGIDDALAEAAGDPSFRPLGTSPVTSPFGVGGPDLPEPPAAELTASTLRALPARDSDKPSGTVEDTPEPASPPVDHVEHTPEPASPPADHVEHTPEPASPPADHVEHTPKPASPPDHEPDKPKPASPPDHEPDKPKVRGPIEFDSDNGKGETNQDGASGDTETKPGETETADESHTADEGAHGDHASHAGDGSDSSTASHASKAGSSDAAA